MAMGLARVLQSIRGNAEHRERERASGMYKKRATRQRREDLHVLVVVMVRWFFIDRSIDR
jgi:hypothetical protein